MNATERYITKKRTKMEDNGFFEKECDRMKQEARLDTLRAEEYKRQFAECVKGIDIKSMLTETELHPKPRKKPFGMRFREFIERLKNTL